MTVHDRGLSVQEVDALSSRLEVDLESAFRTIQAHVLWLLSKFGPQQALAEIDRLFGGSITDYMSVEDEVDGGTPAVVE